MTFWYVFRNGLNFFKLFKLYFHLGLITTPHVLYVHMTYVYSFSHVSFFTRSHGQEKSLSYYDLLYDFGVLFYGRTPTLIFFYFLHNPTTPILTGGKGSITQWVHAEYMEGSETIHLTFTQWVRVGVFKKDPLLGVIGHYFCS